MKIFLIRHGQSIANSKGILQGQRVDSPLSELGKIQAEKISHRLKNEKIDAIYSSDLLRAKETAEKISLYHQKEIILDKRLREFDAGNFMGMENTWIEFEKYKIKEAKLRGIEKHQVKAIGGESEEDHFLRVKEFFNEVKIKHSKNIIIVAHGGTNKILFGIIGHTSRNKIYSIPQGNCCLNEINVKEDKIEVSKINCLLHLDSDKKLIEVFNRIKNEPLNPIDNRCWEKSKRLKKELENLGYKTKFGICSFKWSFQKIPEEILKIPHEDLGYHLFLWIKIYGSYLILDPSNDPLLPNSENWDGLSSCELGVIPEEILDKYQENSISEKEEIENKNKEKYPEFYEAVNNFLEKIRKR
jgi:broad specificity phosphatase PhoE